MFEIDPITRLLAEGIAGREAVERQRAEEEAEKEHAEISEAAEELAAV